MQCTEIEMVKILSDFQMQEELAGTAKISSVKHVPVFNKVHVFYEPQQFP